MSEVKIRSFAAGIKPSGVRGGDKEGGADQDILNRGTSLGSTLLAAGQ